jgi:hypothetical protein
MKRSLDVITANGVKIISLWTDAYVLASCVLAELTAYGT